MQSSEQQQQQQHNRDILPNGDPDHQRDGLMYMQALERKREKNKIAARLKRNRKKQRLEALELRAQELSLRRRQLENELHASRLANQSFLLSLNPDGVIADGGDDEDARRAEARSEVLQSLCDEVRAVCAQAQSAIEALTDMRRELATLLENT
ncbi:hypothetical protein GGI21_000508 [Coemansia aciculifera]|nr:hypothetical protein GGI21_000508 [Coemansia aciculifera]